MRHQRAGRKLGRDSAHRKALYANLTASLIEHGRIKTTVAKAKEVRPVAEEMITLGRRGDVPARRLLPDRQARPAPGRRCRDGVPGASRLRAARLTGHAALPSPALTAAITTPANVTVPSARAKLTSKKRQRSQASVSSSKATTTIAETSAIR